ncbi:S-adenosyl-L-methionine-dependent methyltransferase [Punctularia strigosozonata HHB-11173 SS5]|uniref:S-adenosyl-L-methionine-dependent methyltransferase n=1 Tax=Punctularia strigosozonata (strain HHB-11173) TaxID=741275 RepID=UPI00044178A8|nr:S-adenosyl-L-methionine-dependent methyltransferase [Punctularia strigosozonata HHB-11173 SS5]EIN11879.1 S-adenosyl-L-methionine-dependent methyltransferase [Punctularia strigosozonata HHB-11173 SS5]
MHIAASSLLGILTRAIGRENAASELRWITQHARRHMLPPSAVAGMVARRVAGEPLQYILGTQPFGDLELIVRPPILIPRPETEDWTIRLAKRITPVSNRPLRILDLCTGSGFIPLLLCHLLPPGSVQAVGVDLNPDAVKLSMDNARHCGISTDTKELGLRNVFTAAVGDVRSPEAALSNALEAPFDVLTANPPYIPRHEYELLPKTVKKYEDLKALLSDQPLDPGFHDDEKGLYFYRRISELVSRPGLLQPGGTVVLEVGHDQARAVEILLQATGGLKDTEIWRDPWGVERVVLGQAPHTR